MILPEMSPWIGAATFFHGFFVQRNQADDGGGAVGSAKAGAGPGTSGHRF